jgi:hypothetical protein
MINSICLLVLRGASRLDEGTLEKRRLAGRDHLPAIFATNG